MAHLRVGRPSFLPQLARAAAVGVGLAAALAVLLAVLGFPAWGETVAGFLSTFAVFLVVGVLFRLGTHLMHAHVHAGAALPSREEREDDLKWSGRVLAFGFGSLLAWLVLVLAHGLGTGDWSP